MINRPVIPPFEKGGVGGIYSNSFEIPLNPPLWKGDFLFDGYDAYIIMGNLRN